MSFEIGKVYKDKNEELPLDVIYECTKYDMGIVLDTYYFEKSESNTARVYETQGSLNPIEDFNIDDFVCIGTTETNFEIGSTFIREIKPSYEQLKAKLDKAEKVLSHIRGITDYAQVRHLPSNEDRCLYKFEFINNEAKDALKEIRG